MRAEERAGYFRRDRAPPSDGTPATGEKELRLEPKEGRHSATWCSPMLESARHADIVPLGSAFPSPQALSICAAPEVAGRGHAVAQPLEHGGGPAAGSDHLRKQIGLALRRHGHVPLAPDEVLVTNGALEDVLEPVPGGCDAPGLETSWPSESPGFYAALQAIERLDLRAVEIPVSIYPVHRPGPGRAAELRLNQHPIRACWFMPNFQNPTGTSLVSGQEARLWSRLLRETRGPAHRRRRLPRASFEPRPSPLAAKAFDNAGARDALQLRSRKRSRPAIASDGRRPGRFCRQGATAEADDDALCVHSGAGGALPTIWSTEDTTNTCARCVRRFVTARANGDGTP